MDWSDSIVLNQEVNTKDQQSGIWKAEYNYHEDCGDCVVKRKFSLVINHRDSVAFLTESVTNYTSTFTLPFFDQYFGRIDNSSSYLVTSSFELRGNCIVEMARNDEDRFWSGEPNYSSFKKIGCELSPNDWPVKSYRMQRKNNSIVLNQNK